MHKDGIVAKKEVKRERCYAVCQFVGGTYTQIKTHKLETFPYSSRTALNSIGRSLGILPNFTPQALAAVIPSTCL